MIDTSLATLYADLPKKDVWINEALYGYRHINPYLGNLPTHAKVLEVGSGSGILLSLIKRDFPHLLITGLEPIGQGFSDFVVYHHKLEELGVRIARCGYEDFHNDERYDFIFLVNVFEHLPSWENFLKFLKAKLTPNGMCLILCPNYGFPYESHFRLPILLNKKITGKVFRDYIEKFEQENECTGLWSSLNFVKWYQVKKACEIIGLQTHFDNSVIADLVDRLDADPEFQRRQKFLGRFAKIAKKVGLLRLAQWHGFDYINPYMKLELSLPKK